jgi:hypothetical protein
VHHSFLKGLAANLPQDQSIVDSFQLALAKSAEQDNTSPSGLPPGKTANIKALWEHD